MTLNDEDPEQTDIREPQRLDDDELENLAWRIANGDVYIANEQEAVETSFGFIIGMAANENFTEDAWEEFADHVGAVYADVSKAATRSVNGRPLFFTATFLHIDDLDPLIDAIEGYEHELDGLSPDAAWSEN